MCHFIALCWFVSLSLFYVSQCVRVGLSLCVYICVSVLFSGYACSVLGGDFLMDFCVLASRSASFRIGLRTVTATVPFFVVFLWWFESHGNSCLIRFLFNLSACPGMSTECHGFISDGEGGRRWCCCLDKLADWMTGRLPCCWAILHK